MADARIDVTLNGSDPITEGDPSLLPKGAPPSSDVSIDLYVQHWSYSTHAECPIQKDSSGSKEIRVCPGDQTVRSGIVLRQPALGLVRACIGSCPQPDKFEVATNNKEAGDGDVAVPFPVSVPQLGKKLVMPVHNPFGRDTNLTLTLGPDGTLTTLSVQDNSTIAAGLTGVGNAATAYTNAIAARNTAIAAQNTAAAAVAGYPDTVLKGQADCLQQQAAIVKAGGTPAIQC